MKKKILKIILIILGIIIFAFLANFIKENIDASTEFVLDNENKFTLNEIGIEPEGGLANYDYYYEIDLTNKYVDYRYDFEYYEGIEHISDIQRFLNNKKRKLIKRYKITDEQAIELKEYFEKMNKEYELKVLEEESPTTIEQIFEKMSKRYYVVNSMNKSFSIEDTEDKRELKDIFKKINKDINI